MGFFSPSSGCTGAARKAGPRSDAHLGPGRRHQRAAAPGARAARREGRSPRRPGTSWNRAGRRILASCVWRRHMTDDSEVIPGMVRAAMGSPGRPGALRRRAPLRTRTCGFHRIRLKQALMARRRCAVPGPCLCGSRRVRDGRQPRPTCQVPRRDRVDRVAGDGQPLLPLARVLWHGLVSDQRAAADRAATILGFDQPSGGLVDRQGRLAPSAGPVFDKGGVVW